ncbi:WXG100 family type VII secretion target [Streptomyces bugieae]|uniref:WXG100 family type VII secretion target n=1 Tax=Streptomyces bugieae TaxID=3098223 RepID=A0ABU7NIV5_9ACTN|nr:WXG100 family type VII secretion target [Streptomyces sp. DSM 41528]
MAGPQQEQQPQIESFDLFNPGGDPSVLRACAEAWRHMAHDLKGTIETQDQEVTRLGDDWTGAAAAAFHAHWKHTRGQMEKVLPQSETVAHQRQAPQGWACLSPRLSGDHDRRPHLRRVQRCQHGNGRSIARVRGAHVPWRAVSPGPFPCRRCSWHQGEVKNTDSGLARS